MIEDTKKPQDIKDSLEAQEKNDLVRSIVPLTEKELPLVEVEFVPDYSHITKNWNPLTRTVEETGQWCLDNGFPPLPVAPKQKDHIYEINPGKRGKVKSLFTGKNPSYLNTKGSPEMVYHGENQEAMPTDQDIKTWFSNPLNGIGTLGSEKLKWIDWDLKNFNKSQAQLDGAFYAWLEQNPILQTSWIEQTHSGGYRVGVFVNQDSGSFNFALEAEGKHLGEVIGYGKFTVLAPTTGVSGKPYRILNAGSIVQIERLEDISIYSCTKGNSKKFKQLTPSQINALSTLERIEYIASKEAEDSSQEVTEVDVKRAYIMLQWLIDNAPHSASIEYGLWLLILMALHAVDDSPEMITKVDEWSRGGNNYDEGCVEDKWHTFSQDGNRTGKTSLGTFVNFAKDFGCPVTKKNELNKDPQELEKYTFKQGNYPRLQTDILLNETCIGIWKDDKKTDKIPASKGEPLSKHEHERWVMSSIPNDGGFEDAWKKQIFEVKLDAGLKMTKSLEGTQGGGYKLIITAQRKRLITKEIFLPSCAFLSSKDFMTELQNATGMHLICTLTTIEIQQVFSALTNDFILKGGDVEKMIDKIGLQDDGKTYVFNQDSQFDIEGNSITSESSGWVFNDRLENATDGDVVPIPKTSSYSEDCFTNLWNSVKKALGDNKYRALLAIGAAIASLHYRKIVSNTTGFGFFPIFSAYGDAQTGKTTSIKAALSLLGLHENGLMSRCTVSAIYEQSKLRSGLPVVWDDPQQDQLDKLEELTRNFYNAAARVVRGNTQKPNSPLMLTTNYQVGEYSAAISSRLVAVEFIKTKLDVTELDNLAHLENLASGRLGDLIALGFEKTEVLTLANTLSKYLQNTESRASINLAIMAHYAIKFLELISPPDAALFTEWLFNYCSGSKLDSSAQNSLNIFFEKCNILLSQNRLGDWNIKQSEHHVDIWLVSVFEAVKKEFPKLDITKKILGGLLTQAGAIEASSRMVPDIDSSKNIQFTKPSIVRKVLRIPLNTALLAGWSNQAHDVDFIDPGMQLTITKLEKSFKQDFQHKVDDIDPLNDTPLPTN